MGMDFLNGRKTWFLLAGILTIGGFLRFHALDRQSLWDDEVSTMHQIALGPGAAIHRFEVYEAHPPLYFGQARLWRDLIGSSLSRLRANSALWGTGSLLVIYLWGTSLAGRKEGLMATALMALSPFHLAYSQEFRPYAWSILLGLLGFWALECALNKDSKWLWWSLVSVSVLLIYSHYWGSFVVLALYVYGLKRASSLHTQRRLIKAALLVILLFSFWIPVLRQQTHAINGLVFWAPRPSLANLLKTFMAFTGGYFRFASSVFYMPGPSGLRIILYVLYAVLLVLGWRKGPLAARLWLILGISIPFILSFWKPGIYVWYRYPSLIYPAFVMLTAAGVHAVPGRFWRGTAATVLLLAGGAGCWAYAEVWQKANPRAVMSYVNHLKDPQTLIIRPSYFSDLYNYYDDHRPAVVINEDAFDDKRKRQALRGHPVILLKFDTPDDPVGDALVKGMHVHSVHYFPGYADLGITVYELR